MSDAKLLPPLPGTTDKRARTYPIWLAPAIWGVVVSVIGGIVMGATWPHDEVSSSFDYFTNSPTTDVTHHGSLGGFVVGAIIGWIGSLLIAVAVIAAGVRLALREHASRI